MNRTRSRVAHTRATRSGRPLHTRSDGRSLLYAPPLTPQWGPLASHRKRPIAALEQCITMSPGTAHGPFFMERLRPVPGARCPCTPYHSVNPPTTSHWLLPNLLNNFTIAPILIPFSSYSTVYPCCRGGILVVPAGGQNSALTRRCRRLGTAWWRRLPGGRPR